MDHDEAALVALQGILASHQRELTDDVLKLIVKTSWRVADLMVEESIRRQTATVEGDQDLE